MLGLQSFVLLCISVLSGERCSVPRNPSPEEATGVEQHPRLLRLLRGSQAGAARCQELPAKAELYLSPRSDVGHSST